MKERGLGGGMGVGGGRGGGDSQTRKKEYQTEKGHVPA